MTVVDYENWFLTSTSCAECSDCGNTVNVPAAKDGDLGALLAAIDQHECTA